MILLLEGLLFLWNVHESELLTFEYKLHLNFNKPTEYKNDKYRPPTFQAVHPADIHYGVRKLQCAHTTVSSVYSSS